MGTGSKVNSVLSCKVNSLLMYFTVLTDVPFGAVVFTTA